MKLLVAACHMHCGMKKGNTACHLVDSYLWIHNGDLTAAICSTFKCGRINQNSLKSQIILSWNLLNQQQKSCDSTLPIKKLTLIRLMCAVEALGEIARKLGKKNWKFSIDPCLNDSTSSYNNSVSCNCHYRGGVCHIELM
jgi:hypothetical protein